MRRVPDLTTRPVRWVARLLGFPQGLGELIAAPIRRRLLWSLVGSFVISLFDMVGVLAMFPMMQYVSGQDTDTGALGWVNSLLGDPGDRQLVITIATCIVAAFVLKDLFSILFRRWQLRVMADQEVYTSTRMLEGYLVGPYAWYLARNTADKVWTIEYAVQIGYIAGVSSALGALTEVLTMGLIFLSLLIVTPVATLSALLYFGLAGIAVQRFIRHAWCRCQPRSMAATTGRPPRSHSRPWAPGRRSSSGVLTGCSSTATTAPAWREPAHEHPPPFSATSEVPPRDHLVLGIGRGCRRDATTSPRAGIVLLACSWRPEAGSSPARSG